jgi:RimJ/RimL family protein N-acetyltransferase
MAGSVRYSLGLAIPFTRAARSFGARTLAGVTLRAASAPFRIETARLRLCSLGPEHAAQVQSVVTANKEHLQVWLPWVRSEPLTFEARLELLRGMRHNFAGGIDFVYGIFESSSGDYVGGAGLHRRLGPGALEIGYWIAAEREGRGLVTEAVAALVIASFELMTMERLEIRCSPANVRSRKVAERAGFRFAGKVEMGGFSGTGELEDKLAWALDAREYVAHPLSRSPKPRLFDALGVRVGVADS